MLGCGRDGLWSIARLPVIMDAFFSLPSHLAVCGMSGHVARQSGLCGRRGPGPGLEFSTEDVRGPPGDHGGLLTPRNAGDRPPGQVPVKCRGACNQAGSVEVQDQANRDAVHPQIRLQLGFMPPAERPRPQRRGDTHDQNSVALCGPHVASMLRAYETFRCSEEIPHRPLAFGW